MNPEDAKAKMELASRAQMIASFSPRSAIALQYPEFYRDVQSCVKLIIQVCGGTPDENTEGYFDQLQTLQGTLSEFVYPLEADGMRNYWMAWYSKDDAIVPDFESWITGETMDEPPEFTFTGVIRASSLEAAVEQIKHYYPDYRERFGHAMSADYVLSDRFKRANS